MVAMMDLMSVVMTVEMKGGKKVDLLVVYLVGMMVVMKVGLRVVQ